LPFCSLIARPLPWSNTTAANNLTALYSQYVNIATLDTYGADFEANYATRLADRPLNLRALVSYQPHDVVNQGPGGIVDMGNSASGINLWPASPAVKFSVIAQYSLTDDFTATVLERGRSGMRTTATPNVVYAHPMDPPMYYTNLNLSYNMKGGPGQTELYLNIQNLFNAWPTYNGGGLLSGDDPIGRYFVLGVRFRH
jgi:outer membrane receptor protein involved in Fe transport